MGGLLTAVPLLFACIFASLFVHSHAQCSVGLYVAKTGNDTNSGSQSSPFLTISAAWSSPNLCSNGTIWIATGTYNETSSTFSTTANLIALDDNQVTVVMSNGLQANAQWQGITVAFVHPVSSSILGFQNCTLGPDVMSINASAVIFQSCQLFGNVSGITATNSNISIFNCVFSGTNTTGALAVTGGVLIVENSTFSQNNYFNTAATCLQIISITSATLTTYICGGAAIRANSPLAITIQGSTFDSNAAHYVVSIVSPFGGGNAYEAGAIVINDGKASQITIENNVFSNNSVSNTGIVTGLLAEALFIMLLGNAYIHNTTCVNNKGGSNDGTVTIYTPFNATVSNAVVDGLYINNFVYPLTAYGINVTVKNSVFTSGTNSMKATIFNSFTIDNCTFSNMTAPAFVTTNKTATVSLIINNSAFQNFTVTASYLQFSYASNITIANTVINNIVSSTYLLPTPVDSVYTMNIINTTFSHLTHAQSIALNFTGKSMQLNIVNSSFIGLSSNALSGGPIVITGNDASANSLTIIGSLFENNSAIQTYGALNIGLAYWTIIGSRFINNTGVLAGALTMIKSLSASSLYTIRGCIFKDNYSTGSGGAATLYYGGIIDNSTFINNSAANGGGALSIQFPSGSSIITNITNSNFINNTDSSMGQGGGAILASLASAAIGSCEVIINNSNFTGCSSTNDGGAIWLTSASSIYDLVLDVESSIFENNSAISGGAIYANPLCIGSILSSRFTSNNAQSSGGAYSSDNAKFLIMNTIIEKCISGLNGGGISLSISNGLDAGNITNCTFDSNQAIIGSGGGAYIYTDGSSTFSNCKFINNFASGGGGAVCTTLNSEALFVDCDFDSNTAFQGGAVLVDLYGSPTFLYNNFTNNNASSAGGAVLAQSASQPTFSASVFSLNTAQNGGGIATTGESLLTIQDCIFNHNSAQQDGGGLYSSATVSSYPNIQNAQFIGNAALNGGGLACTSSNAMQCSNCSFINNNAQTYGGGVYIDTLCKLNLTQATVKANSAPSGGGVYCDEGNILTLYGSTIESNTATTGGALQWGKAVSSTGAVGIPPISSTSLTASGSVTISTSLFKNNSAIIGGALDINYNNIDIFASSFTSNRANFGAGLYVVGGLLGFSANNFSANEAENAGGAYFWDIAQMTSGLLSCQSCNYDGNEAAYGYNYATGPALMDVNIVNQSALEVVNEQVGPMTLMVFDWYNQLVTSSATPLFSQVYLSSEDGELYGGTVFYFSEGTALVDAIGINGLFNHNYTLTFVLTGAPNVTVTAEYHGCSKGQEGYTSGDFQACRECAAGFYNLIGNNTCYPCPDNAVCSGGANIPVADTNYWLLIDNGFASTYDCPDGFCDSDGQCADHRSGLLCGTCDHGYQNSGGDCIVCTETDPGSLFANLLLLWIFIIALQLVSKAPEKSQDAFVSGLTKIVVFFVQTVSFVVTPTHRLRKFFSFFNFQFFFNVASKCSFKADFYQNFLIYNFLPAILAGFLVLNIIIQFIAYTVCRLLHHRWESRLKLEKSWYIRTLTALLSFSYTEITQNVILFLNCRDVGDNRIVASNPDVSCRTDKYHHYSALAYILLALYVLAFPIALMGFLYWARLRKWFDNEKFSIYAGLLFQPFRKPYFFWEVVILVRRLIVVGIYVLAYSTTSARNLSLFCFMALMLIVHIVTQPFASKTENRVETALLFLLVILAGAGSSTASEQYSDQISTFTTVVEFMAVIPIAFAVYEAGMALLVHYHIIRPSATASSRTVLTSSRKDLLSSDTPTNDSPSTTNRKSSSPTAVRAW